MLKRLLIIEEALRDRKAHWFSYIKTIARAAADRGMKVDVACNFKADTDIISAFNSFPIFGHSVYLDQHRRKLPGERFYSFILHSYRMLKALWPLLKKGETYDEIFVPTVLVQHLLAWWVIMNFHSNRPRRLTLFFVATPGVWNEDLSKSEFPRSSILMRFLLRRFRRRKDVRLGVETTSALKEYESMTDLKFTLFPHPVEFDVSPAPVPNSLCLEFCCYGFARHEKGSDLLASAVNSIEAAHMVPGIHFRVQWIDTFRMPDGADCGPDNLKNNKRVTLITHALNENEYLEELKNTTCMLLPYRNSSYHSRLSRVAIEAAFLGIPMIYTKGGWLEEHVVEYGAGIGIKDGSVDELVNAIETMAAHINEYKKTAVMKMSAARDYYSGHRFVDILLK
ncbi:MAG: glycosyltransferase [Bacteroidota bacterium]